MTIMVMCCTLKRPFIIIAVGSCRLSCLPKKKQILHISSNNDGFARWIPQRIMFIQHIQHGPESLVFLSSGGTATFGRSKKQSGIGWCLGNNPCFAIKARLLCFLRSLILIAAYQLLCYHDSCVGNDVNDHQRDKRRPLDSSHSESGMLMWSVGILKQL